MKTRYFVVKILLFSAIFSLFLLFPLFQNSRGQTMDFSTPSVFFISLSEFLSGAAILILCKRLYAIPMYLQFEKWKQNTEAPSDFDMLGRPQDKKTHNRKIRAFHFLKDAGDVFLCFGILCVFSAILQALAVFFPSKKVTDIIFPNGIKWLVCIFTLFFSAFYEESLYRVFVPEYLLSIFTKDFSIGSAKVKKCACALCEFFALLLFALSHRYLGAFSVVNAALAHIAFRFFLKKDNNLLITVCAHFLYNLLSLLLVARCL